jgi:transposase
MKQKPLLDLWSLFAPMVEKRYGRKPGAGRPPVDLKRTFEAILWILKTGAPWRSIPEDLYPSYQSCHRYFQLWTREGLFKKLMRKVRRHPLYGGDIRVKEMFYLDGSFAPSKKGGLTRVLPRREKELRSWYSQMRKAVLYL